jgi:carbamoyltransferase
MLLVQNVRSQHRKTVDASLKGMELLNAPRSSVPAITHVDNSARIQTVDAATNPLFHRLISSFKEVTGCPILINTSFNVRGEPIVCTPEDAFRCFMGTHLDMLVIGNCILYKDRQDKRLAMNYAATFELD